MKQLPHFKIKGSYEEVGHFIGHTFRHVIQQSIQNRRSKIPNYAGYLQKSQQYLDITKAVFPNLIVESEAIARASEVPLIDFFFLNNREVYDGAELIDQQSAANQDHCTVVVGFDKGQLVVGHNEDWALKEIDKFGILEVEIEHTKFLGLHYMNTVPGPAAMMNDHGLVQCINDVYQRNQLGVPKNYVARAILEAKTLQEAEQTIRKTPKASGFNHVLAQGNEIRNIEIAGNKIAIEQVFNKPYVHTNHYLTNELKNLEKFHTQSSEARFKRARTLLKSNMTTQDIKAILSDTQNKQFPICRSDETIGSAIFSPHTNSAQFCYGHPCAGKYIEYSLS